MNMQAAVITAFATIFTALVAFIGSTISIYLTKKKEREAVWRAKKLAYYEEFFGAASGIAVVATDEAKIRFATAMNNLHLIASGKVLKSLHAFLDEIDVSNAARFTQAKHDELWSMLVWDIRADLGDPPCPNAIDFQARLRRSGVNHPVLLPEENARDKQNRSGLGG
ncbi:hypothetical protein [Granulibacter bethesdensis]|uniref:hypothetical protein n=1 Tax=Granulibacter bethesdensis TaxID=364410 RepID=UPI000F79FE81|nr:hypothetical protein [Granulibacter bethesdensis]